MKKKPTTYAEKLKDPRWQKKRLEVLEASKWMCDDCGDTKSTLSVHHTYYEFKREPWEYGLDTLMCLCEDCHTARQDGERDLKLEFSRLLKLVQLDDFGFLLRSINRCVEEREGFVTVIPSHEELRRLELEEELRGFIGKIQKFGGFNQ